VSGASSGAKPRALSFRVSPVKLDGPGSGELLEAGVGTAVSGRRQQLTQKYPKLAESHRVVGGSSTRVHHATDGGEAFAEMIDQRAASLPPPPLPERQRSGSRQPEPALFPSMPKVEMMGFEVQRHQVGSYLYITCKLVKLAG